jgi:nucleotide-binding universal stress UspA family protein
LSEKSRPKNSEFASTPSRILVPIDGSDNSKRALNIAVMLSNNFDAELLVLNVIPTPSILVEAPTGLGLPPTGNEQYYEQQEINSNRFLDEAMSFCRAGGVRNYRCEATRASESVVEEIIEFADKKRVDLIVIGTRGLGGFRKLLLGSVSSGVVTHASCNVLVVR